MYRGRSLMHRGTHLVEPVTHVTRRARDAMNQWARRSPLAAAVHGSMVRSLDNTHQAVHDLSSRVRQLPETVTHMTGRSGAMLRAAVHRVQAIWADGKVTRAEKMLQNAEFYDPVVKAFNQQVAYARAGVHLLMLSANRIFGAPDGHVF